MSWRARCWLLLRFVRRELLSGELTLLLALALAVTAMSSVAFFSQRIERALGTQASQLLAADLVAGGNEALPDALRIEARRRGLALAEDVRFPSMVFAGGQAALASYKAVGGGYPLRGTMTIRGAGGRESSGALQPAPGSAWADARLLRRLGLQAGDEIAVGNARLRVAGEIVREPDAALDFYNFVPRLIFNRADLAATGLIQPGSRARWRLMFAGEPRDIADFRPWLRAHLPKGGKVESVEDARPEVRIALERARGFLGLTAMLTVVLAVAAVALVVRRYLARHWRQVAVLRCLGLTSRGVLALFGSLFLLLGLIAGALGSAAGYGVQSLLMQFSSSLLGEALPTPDALPWLIGPLSALLLLAGLALPPLLLMGEVPPAAVLRDEPVPLRPGWAAPFLTLGALLLLAAWQVGDGSAAVWLFAALLAFLLAVALLSAAALWLLSWLPRGRRVGWRFGLVNLSRRRALTVLQSASLSVGLMALLTLTVVRGDLLDAWQSSVPADAPNQFVLNIQPAQLKALGEAFTSTGRPAPEFSPMTRARLLAINEQPVRPSAYDNEQARHLAEREFNLSWRADPPPGNRLVAGQWWSGKRVKPQFSVERKLAELLGIRLGDTLAFDLAGSTYRARVTSLREVPWDSFRVNFFVIGTPGQFERQSAGWITSFRLPAGDEDFINRLVVRFPNLTVLDVGSILQEVRTMVDKLAHGVEAMFALALMAGALVLWAALWSTRDERLADAALMRALGASRGQLRVVLLSELLWLGAFSGLLAALGAMGLGALLALKVLNLAPPLNWFVPLWGMLAGMLVAVLAGWPLLGRVLRAPPMAALRAL